MTCPRCQSRDCSCQARLLPAPAPWRSELQQRVASYRARRADLSPEAPRPEAPRPEAPPEPANPAPARLLSFPAAASPTVHLHPTASSQPAISQLEPLADPVIIHRPQRHAANYKAAEPELRARVLPPPEDPVLPPLVLPPPALDAGLAEPVSLHHQASRSPMAQASPMGRSLPSAAAAFLQIPLPLSTTPAADPLPAALPVASRQLRLQAGGLDAALVLVAAALFAAAGWFSQGALAPDAQTIRHLLPAAVAVPGVLAALYFLACFYAGDATIGMRCFGLRVRSFEGPLTAAAQRRRAWAYLVSLAALGLGYAWAYCDSQQLTWHDYISRTFIAADSAPLPSGEPAPARP